MKRFVTGVVLALIVFFLVPGGPGFAAPDKTKLPDFTVTGPYTYLNLTVFLIHGKDKKVIPDYMPLTRALEDKKARVYETGDVGRLAVENLSKDAWVMVHAGDIVRGGRQDRMLRFDMLLPPRSGKVPLDSFCVESGRWHGRGSESAAQFAAAPKMATSKNLKIAARKEADQGRVWSSVAEQQNELNEKLRKLKGDKNLDVRAARSATSLALALENKDLENTVRDYVGAIRAAAQGKKDVLGFAFAVNGCLNSAEVYATHDLFSAFWPRVLEAAATEALGSYEPGVTSRCAATAEQVRKLLAFPGATSIMPGKKDLSRDTKVFVWEHGPFLMYETLGRGPKADPWTWVHRSFLVQDGGGAPRPRKDGRYPQSLSPSADLRQTR